MSLVGTRPPTVDEWDKYELHHRARLATKPGLTGMWQVSGRSNITDLESMVQRVYRQIRTVDTDATVTIATSKSQVSAIHNQLGENVGISVEPCRRDTFPAIALAAAYLKDVQHIGESSVLGARRLDLHRNRNYKMAGRPKKKPEYNPELQFNNFLQELRDAYEEADSLRSLADELNISLE